MDQALNTPAAKLTDDSGTVVPFEDAPELFADLAARRRHELPAVLAFDPRWRSHARPQHSGSSSALNHATSGCGPVEVSPLAGGKIVDVALEIWAIFVVTSIAGSLASFFSSGDSS